MLFRRALIPSTLTVALVLCAGRIAAAAEDFEGRALAGIDAYEQGGCAHVRISFTRRLDIHIPQPGAEADEMRIVVKSPEGTGAAPFTRQSLSPPSLKGTPIHAIELDPTESGADLSIYFRQSADIRVAPDRAANNVVLGFPVQPEASSCGTDFDEALLDAVEKAGLEKLVAVKLRDAKSQAGADILVQARKSMIAGNYDSVIDATHGLLGMDGGVFDKETRELLALAYEAKGAHLEAKAEYLAYLERYPAGDDAGRIRARLATLGAAPKDQIAKLVVSSAGSPSDTQGAKTVIPAPKSFSEVTDARPSRDRVWDTPLEAPPKDPAAWSYGYVGSVSSYYERNQGGRDYYVAPLINQGWEKDRIDQLYLNSILSSFDFDTHFERHGFAGKIRAAASLEHKLIDEDDEYLLSTLYYDADWKEGGYGLRFGRQSRYTGGVLGRFDGGLASLQYNDRVKLNGVAGAPVESSSDRPFEDDRYFYGLSADIAPWDAGKDFTLFFINQVSDGLLDRRGIGAEARLMGDAGTIYASSDFDIHYRELNSALFSASRYLGETSQLTANFDFRRSPLIFTTNALQQQNAPTLGDMLSKYSLADVETLALDRSAKSYTAALSYAAPINDRLRYCLDGTWTYLSATDGSAGVAPTEATGIEFYGLVQLMADSVFTEGDMLTTGVRYDDTQSALRYMFELGERYPAGENWRVSPVLRLGYADYKLFDATEYQLMPTFRASYLVNRDVTIDFEIGKKWLVRETARGSENEDELLVLTGIRYDIGSDR